DVPDTLDDFLDRFGGIADPAEPFADSSVDCAGVTGATTALSPYDRALCRYNSVEGSCWRAFDHDSAVGTDVLLDYPLELAASDGGEAFCALDSGMQV